MRRSSTENASESHTYVERNTFTCTTSCSLNATPNPDRISRKPVDHRCRGALQLAALVRSDERDAATEADFTGALDLLYKVDALASRSRIRRDPDRSLELRQKRGVP